MMHATRFRMRKIPRYPPPLSFFLVDGYRRSESLTRTTNFLVSFPRRFCLSFVVFSKLPPKKWRMLTIGSAVNNHREPVHLPGYSRVPKAVFTSFSLPRFFIFSCFVFMEALLFAHIEWRSAAHATSYSEWNGLFWK